MKTRRECVRICEAWYTGNIRMKKKENRGKGNIEAEWTVRRERELNKR
jgi:hypothetical protein